MNSNSTSIDNHFMELALEQAQQALLLDEVPIGAVVVYEGSVIARAHNRRETDRNPAGHAEFIALQEAARVLDAWRLTGCTVYVTLEPCVMCAGLMYQSRVSRCVYGAPDPKAGALGSLYRIHEDHRLNHAFEVTAGVRAEESSQLLKGFFAQKRAVRRERKVNAAHDTGVADIACDTDVVDVAAANRAAGASVVAVVHAAEGTPETGKKGER